MDPRQSREILYNEIQRGLCTQLAPCVCGNIPTATHPSRGKPLQSATFPYLSKVRGIPSLMWPLLYQCSPSPMLSLTIFCTFLSPCFSALLPAQKKNKKLHLFLLCDPLGTVGKPRLSSFFIFLSSPFSLSLLPFPTSLPPSFSSFSPPPHPSPIVLCNFKFITSGINSLTPQPQWLSLPFCPDS